MAKDKLSGLINIINSNNKFPAVQLVKNNPEVAALISKLIRPQIQSDLDINRKDTYVNLNQGQIQNISDSIKGRTNDNENIIQLFPDIELAIQIIVSSILSPKDMMKTELIYKTKEQILPSDLTLKLTGIIKNHFENYYKMHEEQQIILRDTLFAKGSYIKAILPESTVDDIINGNDTISTESIKEITLGNNVIKNIGLLGNPGTKKTTFSLENIGRTVSVSKYESKIVLENHNDKIKYDEYCEVIDNYAFLKLPSVLVAGKSAAVKNVIANNRRTKVSTESVKIDASGLINKIYKDITSKTETFVVISGKKNKKRKSVGRPLVLKLPSESVIPIYIPGNETKHIGYFVLVDGEGNPVTAASNSGHMEGLAGLTNSQNQSQSMSSLLINKARRNLSSNDGNITLDQITKVYSNIIESDLMDRLANGVYGENIAVGGNEEIYRIMLARSFAKKYTRLVYIPAELVTYFAFKYHNNGVGKSYLDDIKVLTSLRAIMLFSKVMAMTKSSIALTHVNLTLDENDPDPQKTVELATHEIVKMRQQYFPLGINSPADVVDWIQRAGFEFSFEGHPGLPVTKFDFETKNIQHTVPDSDLDELLRKQTYMAFGLSPEVVDNGFNAEFATTVISNNILLSKRIYQLQIIHAIHLTDYCRKLIINDSVLEKELLDSLKENKALVEKSLTDEELTDYKENEESFMLDLLERFAAIVELTLPEPDVTSIETQMVAFDQYSEALEKTLDAWISSDIFASDIAGDINTNIASIRAVVKAYYIRSWMANNGFMGELNDIVTSNEDGEPTLNIFEINKSHIEGVTHSSLKFIKSMKKFKEAANKDLASLAPGEGSGESSSDNTSSDSENDSTSEDDFGDTGEDTEAEEEPAPDNTSKDEEAK